MVVGVDVDEGAVGAVDDDDELPQPKLADNAASKARRGNLQRRIKMAAILLLIAGCDVTFHLGGLPGVMALLLEKGCADGAGRPGSASDMAITLTGRPLIRTIDDRKTDIPERGPIELQTHGSEIRWRNVFIKELPPAK